MILKRSSVIKKIIYISMIFGKLNATPTRSSGGSYNVDAFQEVG